MHLFDGQAVIKSVQFSFSLTWQRFPQNSSSFCWKLFFCCWGRSSAGSGRAGGYPRRCHGGGRGYGQASELFQVKIANVLIFHKLTCNLEIAVNT